MIVEAKKLGLSYHAYSQSPGFMTTYGCDAGLLTVSRYPITKVDFTAYKFPPVGDDAIA